MSEHEFRESVVKALQELTEELKSINSKFPQRTDANPFPWIPPNPPDPYL